MTLNFDMAELVGFACEAFLYGCYTILFFLAVYLKLTGPDRQLAHKSPLFIITVILYLLCSTNFALSFAHYYIALSTTGVKGFANLSNSNFTNVNGILVMIAEIMGDLIIIYRCWMLWSKSYWVIIFPSLSATATLVAMVQDERLARHITSSTQRVPSSVVSFTLASFIILLCASAVITTLIVARIWYLSPRKRRDALQGANFPTDTGRAAIVIIIESGMLYLVVQLIYCVVFTLRLPAQNIIAASVIQIYGIAPTLIFIRMFDLLNLRSLSPSSSGTGSNGPVPQSIETRVVFHHSTIASSDPGQLDATEMPEFDRKSRAGELGSNFASTENTSAV